MRILLAPAGSRGDFQPLLALAVGLKGAGHDVRLAAAPNFREETEAFGIPFIQAGVDVKAVLDEVNRLGGMTPLRANILIVQSGRKFLQSTIDELIEPARHVDVVIGGGAQAGAPTAADAAGVPYFFVAYTPQILPSTEHPPFMLPLRGHPKFLNRALWSISNAMLWMAFGGMIAEARKKLGLPKAPSVEEHFFPPARRLLAFDPEITPLPRDVHVTHPPLGSLALRDERPLPADLVGFLEGGPAPVYIGFGSMPDPDPASTTRMLVEAVQLAGCRAVLSSGWAGFGGADIPANVKVIGPVSHGLLFPRVAAIVHHGGAGTTSSSARAGKPQIVVPHAFDQIEFGARVHEAGLGPEPLPRKQLTARALADAITRTLSDETMRARAAQLGTVLSARDAVTTAVQVLERELAAVKRAAPTKTRDVHAEG